MNKYTDSEFEIFSEIDLEKLNRIICRLENESGTEEEITVEIMKKVVMVAVEKIYFIFNTSLEKKIFPNK